VEVPLVDSEILHSGEGGNAEQWLEPWNKLSCVCVWLCLALYCFTFLYSWYCLSWIP